MSLRTAMEEVLQRGGKFKDQVLNDVINSHAVIQITNNGLFLKPLTKVLTATHEIQQVMKKNFKAGLHAFNVPTRDEIRSMVRKLNRLETEMSSIHRKVLASRMDQMIKKHPTKSKQNAKAVRKKAKTVQKRRK